MRHVRRCIKDDSAITESMRVLRGPRSCIYARDVLDVSDVVISRHKPGDYEPGTILSLVDISDVHLFLVHDFLPSIDTVNTISE